MGDVGAGVLRRPRNVRRCLAEPASRCIGLRIVKYMQPSRFVLLGDRVASGGGISGGCFARQVPVSEYGHLRFGPASSRPYANALGTWLSRP